MKPIFEISLFLICFCALLILTIRDLISVISEYTSEKTTTTVSFVDEPSIPLPDHSICVDIGFRGGLPNPWGETAVVIDAAKAIINSNKWDISLNSTNDSSLLLAIALMSSVELMYAAGIGLHPLDAIQSMRQANRTILELGADDERCEIFKENDTEWFSGARDAFVRTADPSTMTLDAAAKLCERLMGSAQANESCRAEILRRNVFLLDPTELCFPLFPRHITWGMRPRVLRVSPRGLDISGADSWTSKATLYAEQNLALIGGPREREYKAEGLSTTFPISSDSNPRVTVRTQVIGVFTRMDRGSRRCDESNTKSQCRQKCRAEVMRQKRMGCVSFVYRHLYTDSELAPGKYCDTSKYANGWNEAYESMRDGHCDRRCSNLCRETGYVWDYVLTPNVGGPDLEITFEPTAFSFPTFTEHPKVTLPDLMSQIGGIVGLYLGFDGLALYGLVMVIVRMIERFRREPGEEAGDVKRDWQKIMGTAVRAIRSLRWNRWRQPSRAKVGPTAQQTSPLTVDMKLMEELEVLRRRVEQLERRSSRLAEEPM